HSRRIELAPGQEKLQASDTVRDDAPEDVRREIVDPLGEQPRKHRGVGGVGISLTASSERERDVPAALQVRGPLWNDLVDALVLGRVVDRRKRPGARRDAEIPEQPIRADAGETQTVQRGKRGYPQGVGLEHLTRELSR